MPFIKSEPDEFGNNPNQYMQNQNYGNNQTDFFRSPDQGSIDPSALSMSNGNFNMQYGFGSQGMSSSFNMGHSGFDDNELMDSLGVDEFGPGQPMMDGFSGMQSHNQPRGMAVQTSNVYSNTPDGPPIQSPYLGQPDYNHFRSLSSIPQHMSPSQHPQYMSNKRPSMQAPRKSSDTRSPMTPRTAALSGLHIGTPETGSLSNGRPIRTPSTQSRHNKSLSAQYGSSAGSYGSHPLESPLSSPSNALHHHGIGEALSSKHASLPAKVENGSHPTSAETVEAKKRRRRASHNAVERRRRDNINERIQDLSHLVPQHRLDDDRVKKQLASTGPMSPTMGPTSMSPPNANSAATSLLAGPQGRRATSTTGNITMGLPIEEREKGPNKGDILNGAVSWTRDLMWALNEKYAEQEQLAAYITQLGGQWPFAVTEDEKRMRSEVIDAIANNGAETFGYTRTDGTGLRVPKFTNLDGGKITGNSSLSPGSNFEMSPGIGSGGSGTNSSNGGRQQPQFWGSGTGHMGMSFKEEDEDDEVLMEMS